MLREFLSGLPRVRQSCDYVDANSFCDTVAYFRRVIERLLAVSYIGDRRRPYGISTDKLNRTSQAVRSAAAHHPVGRLLEDVFHRHTIGRDRLPARIFPQPHCKVSFYLPARRARGPDGPHASPGISYDRICRNRDSVIPADQSHRQTFGELVHHRLVAVNWWDHYVDRRRDERQVGGRWAVGGRQPHPYLEDGEHDSRAIHLDWFLPNLLGSVSRYVPLHVDHRRRATRWHVARRSA